MKTRAKKGTSSQQDKLGPAVSKIEQLEASVSNPPKVFILPKDTSEGARIISLAGTAGSKPSRYFVCPEKGFYEFTRIAAPKGECRSWLLAPDMATGDDEGYVLESPEMMVATPIDPLFIVLPVLCQEGCAQMFLELTDYVDKLEELSPHLRQMLRDDRQRGNKLEAMLQTRLSAVCDEVEAGDEKMYKLSHQRLLDELLSKARRMAAKGLPASMEDRFVKQALAVPMMSVKREESRVNIATDTEAEDTSAGASQSTTGTSQDTQSSKLSEATAATSIPDNCENNEIVNLLWLKTALDFLTKSYLPYSLHQALSKLDADKFAPLMQHLASLAEMKKEAQALRSMSENISRKRGLDMDDAEAMEKAEAKRRKKEEDEFKKKNVSLGVKKLGKADVSGMKKLSSFFGKKG